MDRPRFDLTTLLDDLPGEPFGDWNNPRITGIAIDSRRVRPGDLFVALPGMRVDGASFLAQAIAGGAVAVVVGSRTGVPQGVAGLRLADPRGALARIADRFFGHPSRSLRVFGVTGTNGKTTVACMISQVLAAAGRAVGHWTTNEVDTRRRRFRPVLTTPDAPDLQAFLAELRDAGGSDACIEVSSHAVVQQRVAQVRFAAGVVTNVTPDHLDYHGDFGRYLEAKRGFFRLLRPPAVGFYNRDDGGAREVIRGAPVEAFSYGFSPGADVRGGDPRLTAQGAGCRVAVGARLGVSVADFTIDIPVPGRHNLSNALAATGVALAQGVPVAAVRAALAAFRPAARRLSSRRVGPYTVIDDVAMNEGSYDAVFSTLAGAGYPRVVVVCALRGNRGAEVNAAIAAVLARWDRRLRFAPVAVSLSRAAIERYRGDYRVRPEEVAAFVAAARREGLSFTLHDELEEAIVEGVVRLRPGDVLLLLGTFGMDDGPALAIRALREMTGIDADGGAPLPEHGRPTDDWPA